MVSVSCGGGVSHGTHHAADASRTAITCQVSDPRAEARYGRSMSTISAPIGIGDLLRDWRQRRRLSQLDLSNEAAVSARHLSFVETGRSKPSRELVLHLAEHLDVPLRERNSLLMAAGFAPVYRERSLDDHEMDPVRSALDMILAGHEPYPSVIVDRLWNLVTANTAALALFTDGVAPELLEPPVNVVRLGVHPDGLRQAHQEPGRVQRAPAHPAAAPAGRVTRRGPPGALRRGPDLPGGEPRVTRRHRPHHAPLRPPRATRHRTARSCGCSAPSPPSAPRSTSPWPSSPSSRSSPPTPPPRPTSEPDPFCVR